jgi:hypothetical protein
MGKSYFIKYDGTENERHRNGKNRITFLLIAKGFKLLTNTVNGEFMLKPDPKLESNYADYYHDSNTKEKRLYQLDCFMRSPKGKYFLFEIDGAYHFATKKSIKKMIIRNAFIKAYFARRKIEIIIIHFKVEELVSRLKVEDEYILNVVIKEVDRNTF